MGTFAWLGMAIAFAETLAAVKFGHGLFTAPWPRRVLAAWSLVGLTFALLFGTWTVRFYGAKPRGRGAGPATRRRSTSRAKRA